MRWWLESFGSKAPFSGIALRGPALNVQVVPSVQPSKWQLAQFCQPCADSRLSVEVVPEALAGRSKCPRDEKNISAPTRLRSPCEPAAGRLAVLTTLVT